MAHEKKGLLCSGPSVKLCLLISVICSGISFFFFTPQAAKTSILATKQLIFNSAKIPFQGISLPHVPTREKHFLKSHENITIQKPQLTTLSHVNANKTTSKNEGKYKDPVPYKFLIQEEDKCKNSAPFLVFLICTKEHEKLRRDNIRKTWGNENLVPGFSVVRLFMLGVQKQGSTEEIRKESRMYRDIIQQDFQDTYYNLTLKVLMGMKWVSSYCPNAHFVMKTDSDMFVNTQYLIQKLLVTISTSDHYFTGFPMRKYHPIRNTESKWYMPLDLYPGETYPDFCSGTGYVFSGSLATMIYKVSFSVKVLHLEDVYVGLCLQKIGVMVSSPPRISLFNPFKVPFNPCVYKNLITSHYISSNELLTFWNLIQKKKHDCSQISSGNLPPFIYFSQLNKRISPQQRNSI